MQFKDKASPHLTHKLGPIVSPGKRFESSGGSVCVRVCVCVVGVGGGGVLKRKGVRERKRERDEKSDHCNFCTACFPY